MFLTLCPDIHSPPSPSFIHVAAVLKNIACCPLLFSYLVLSTFACGSNLCCFNTLFLICINASMEKPSQINCQLTATSCPGFGICASVMQRLCKCLLLCSRRHVTSNYEFQLLIYGHSDGCYTEFHFNTCLLTCLLRQDPLSSPGWPWLYQSPAWASWVLGLQECATISLGHF